MNKPTFILLVLGLIVFNWFTWMMIGFMCIFINYLAWIYHLAPFISFAFMISIIYFAKKVYLTLKD